MDARQLSPIDKLLAGIDGALRATTASPAKAARDNPAKSLPESPLTTSEQTHAARLMRVNHAGEIAAQGLYQGHASVARDPALKDQMQQAADEELDHLGWCEERLRELDAAPSVLSPVWYAGAFAIGAASGVLGDRWSLGFIEETERQVSDHLSSHLSRLPADDVRSRAIVEQMRSEEEQHGANARDAGAASLPRPVKDLMRLFSRVMTTTAYRL